jgi:hypothetical protein
MTSTIALANGTATSYWSRRFSFRFRRRPVGWDSRCCSPAAPLLRLLVSGRNPKAVRGDTHTDGDRQQGDLVSLLLLFQNKDSSLETSKCLT